MSGSVLRPVAVSLGDPGLVADLHAEPEVAVPADATHHGRLVAADPRAVYFPVLTGQGAVDETDAHRGHGLMVAWGLAYLELAEYLDGQLIPDLGGE